jgi:transposase
MGIKLKHIVHLPQGERKQVQQIIHKGAANTHIITRARVLLLADAGKTDKEISGALDLAVSTPYDIRKRYHKGGLQRALYDAPRTGQPRKLTGVQEAKIVAIACTKAPIGYDHWTMDLLTEEAQSNGIQIGRTAIWRVLLRNDIKPWRKKNVVYSHHYA